MNPIESHITLGAVLLVLGILLRQHKIFVRLKDRANAMWREYCERHQIPYESLDNGNH